MEKLRLGLIGLGGQGRAHANVLLSAPEDFPCELVAVCDIDPKKFEKQNFNFNLKEGQGTMGFDSMPCYTDFHEMIAREHLDMVSVVVPTYLHCEITVDCLKAGLHVLCEKPMALDTDECDKMMATAKECGKILMVGQCLRFWNEYIILKSMIDSGEYGKVLAGMFWRGGDTPSWSYQNWMLHKELGGGAIFDQHIHDVDMVQYLFGIPESVSSSAAIIHPGCNYETVCTNYIYPNGPVIFTHNDWTLSYGFAHGFRVNFEKATLEMVGGKLLLHVRGSGTKELTFVREPAVRAETRYLAECILGQHDNVIDPPFSARESVRIVKAEIASADKHAEPVKL